MGALSLKKSGPDPVAIARLKAEALGLVAELDDTSKSLLELFDRAIDRAWRLGLCLAEIKRAVGHGNWLGWIEANLPVGERQAQRYIELAAANPSAKTAADLSEDSVRKFRLGYVPEKERPELDGDAEIKPTVHHLTLLNDFRRLHRRIEIGAASFDREEARRDLRPMWEWLSELYAD